MIVKTGVDMSDQNQNELAELLKEAQLIANYLMRQVNSKAITTRLDIQNIERFCNALDVYKKVSKN
jgi:diadenosine tetraphosphate (Ap4A) HIT family hydrolase